MPQEALRRKERIGTSTVFTSTKLATTNYQNPSPNPSPDFKLSTECTSEKNFISS